MVGVVSEEHCRRGQAESRLPPRCYGEAHHLPPLPISGNSPPSLVLLVRGAEMHFVHVAVLQSETLGLAHDIVPILLSSHLPYEFGLDTTRTLTRLPNYSHYVWCTHHSSSSCTRDRNTYGHSAAGANNVLTRSSVVSALSYDTETLLVWNGRQDHSRPRISCLEGRLQRRGQA